AAERPFRSSISLDRASMVGLWLLERKPDCPRDACRWNATRLGTLVPSGLPFLAGVGYCHPGSALAGPQVSSDALEASLHLARAPWFLPADSGYLLGMGRLSATGFSPVG